MKYWYLGLVIFLSKGANAATSLLPLGGSGTSRVVGVKESSWYMVAVIRLSDTRHSTRLVATGTDRLVFAHSNKRCKYRFTILTGYHIQLHIVQTFGLYPHINRHF